MGVAASKLTVDTGLQMRNETVMARVKRLVQCPIKYCACFSLVEPRIDDYRKVRGLELAKRSAYNFERESERTLKFSQAVASYTRINTTP
jgi:hypothetical protein